MKQPPDPYGWRWLVSEMANINDVLDGHVVLQCRDRNYVNGYIPKLQLLLHSPSDAPYTLST